MNDSLRSLLMVAYFFPPLGGGGVQRTLKFVKYLPGCGWRPIIITTRQSKTHLEDMDLNEEIPPDARIVRTADVGLPRWLPWRVRAWITRWLFLVDEHIGWLLFSIRPSLKHIQRESIQAIYSTSAPYTDHLIGYQLKQRTQLPWVADFRDPWIGNTSVNFPTQLHKRLVEKMEAKVLFSADRVLVVSEPMRQAILSRYTNIPAGKVIVLPNGYDPGDFATLKTDMIQAVCENDRFLMVYSGSFYGQRQVTVNKFLKALVHLLENQTIPRERLRIRFVGNIGKTTLEQIQTCGLKDVCQVTGYLPHRQSLLHLMAADVLLLIIGRGPGSAAVFTGKIFEYLASDKTILCLADPGAAADLVQEAQAGVVIDPEDIPAIANQVATLYQKWAAGNLNKVQPDQNVVDRYDRRALTRQLADILDEITCQDGDKV
jgi:glycosyltransferase involved in cell wall biosynthesis